MRNYTLFFLILFTVLFASARFFIPSQPLSLVGSYQAFAHLFVGGLIGAWLASKDKVCLVLLLYLCLIELGCFLYSKL